MSFPLDYSGFKTLLLVLALPPAPMLLLAAWGGWRLRRRHRGGVSLLALGLVLAWLSATDAAGEALSRLAGRPPLLAPAQVDALQGQRDGAVLVLGGGVRRMVPEFGSGRPTPITAERLTYGVWLARRTGWPLGFTGGIGWTAKELQQSEASIVGRVVQEDYGLALRWAEGRSRDTRENAANTLPLLAQDGVRQVLLVTHEEHMARALRAFEAQAAPLGLRIVAAPVGLRAAGSMRWDDWCPSHSGLERVRYVVYEAMARAGGR